MGLKRLYIRGLPNTTSSTELKQRFSVFGDIQEAFIATDSTEQCRGFGFVTLICEEAQLKRCLTSLNGSSWKGKIIRIEEARPDFLERAKSEATLLTTNTYPRIPRGLIRHSADMTLVDSNNVDRRKGWRRGKFGRPVAIVRLRKKDGSLVVMDPSHDPLALTKFHQTFYLRQVKQLTWFNGDNDYSLDFAQNKEYSGNSSKEEADGSTFILSKLLNLPTVTHSLFEKSENTFVPCSAPRLPISNELDFKKLFDTFEPNLGVFFSHPSPENDISAWKGSRSEIRRDFKKQIKTARNALRKFSLLRKK